MSSGEAGAIQTEADVTGNEKARKPFSMLGVAGFPGALRMVIWWRGGTLRQT
jgi:hypothetical protein